MKLFLSATCTVPANCSVFMLPFALHRSPKYWDKPEVFNPDRFSPENSKNRHPYTFLPFSGGIRSCPGRKFANYPLKIMIAYLLRSYSLSTTATLKGLRLHSHISVRSPDGYPISIKKLPTN